MIQRSILAWQNLFDSAGHEIVDLVIENLKRRDVTDKSKYIKHHDALILDLPEGFTQGDLYFKVSFQLNTTSYKPKGFSSRADVVEFTNEAYTLLESLGFGGKKRESEINCSDVERDGGWLYLHPLSFMGYLTLSEIHRVKAGIEHYDGILSLTGVDVYAAREVVSDTELTNRVILSKESIKNYMLEKLQTETRNEWKEVSAWTPFIYGLSGFDFHRSYNENSLGLLCEPQSQWQLLNKLIRGIANELVKDGILKSTRHRGRTVYRAGDGPSYWSLDEYR